MLRRLFIGVGVLFALPAASETIYCGAVIDTRAGEVLGGHSIVIEENRIKTVDAGRADAVDIDLSGHTCLPGLMDMHTHLTNQLSRESYSERVRFNDADYAVRAVANARKTLLAGFTTVRDLGDMGNVTVALRNAIDRGEVAGPRIATAAKSLATTGGHADPTNSLKQTFMGDPGPREGVVNGADEAYAAVRQRYKDGADLIKITATGGVLSVAKSGVNPQFTDEELAAIVGAASDYGFHVAAHAHGAEGMKRAIRAGVRSIEHGTLMDDEARRLMKRQGTYYVPTISAGEWVGDKAQEEGYFPEMVRVKAAELGPKIRETFGKAYEAGVKIAFGTDAGVSPHGQNAREFELMVAAGMPAMAAIQSATTVSAELLGREDELGAIAPGFLADIVAVANDPIEDVGALASVSFVMKDGRVYVEP